MSVPDARREPRSMTMGDLVSLVAGVALGYAAITSLPGLTFVPLPFVVFILFATNFLLILTTAFSVVALGRVATYRRMPHAAEWLATVVSLSAQASRPEFNVDEWVNFLFATIPGSINRLDFETFDFCRWVVAGLASLATLATFTVLHLGRRVFPPWWKTLLLAWAALLALAGPLWVFGFLGDDLVSPSVGFGAGNLSILHRQLCLLFGHFPTGVFFGVPAMAALFERIADRRWAWGEWAGFVSSMTVGFLSMMLHQGEFAKISPAWLAERGLILAWFVAIALTGRFILMKFGSPWRRWIDGPGDQDRSSPSVSDSDPSIR